MRFTFTRLILLIAVSVAPFRVMAQDYTDTDTDLKGSRFPSWSIDSGSGTAYVLTTFAPLGRIGVGNGSCFKFIAANANTGAATAKIDGGSVISIKRADGTTALSANDIKGLTEICYDGTNFRLASSAGLDFSNISGTLGCSQLPAFTGDVTNSSCAMTVGALHLSATPTLCSAGYYATGIDVNGNATGCTAAASSGGADTLSFDQCTSSQATNTGNSFWTVVSLTNWDFGHWEFVLNTNADIWCSIRVPSNTTSTPHILLDPGSADTTNGHTATLKTCDVQTTSLNFQVGSLTCASTQNYSSTTTAYSVTELSFAVQSTVTAGQILVVDIKQASGGSNTSNVVMSPPKYKIN